MDDDRRRKIIWGIAGSILFHLILLLILLLSGMNLFFSPIPKDSRRQIKVTLRKPPPVVPVEKQEPVRRQEPDFYELVDNPNANEQNPQKGNMLSDKSSVSAAMQPSTETRLPDQPAEKTLDNRSGQSDQTYAFKNSSSSPYKTFSRGLLVPQSSAEKNNEEPNDNKKINSPSTTNRSDIRDPKVFDPQQVGAFALNTYAWEYAPYMKKWLRYLQQHWVAPPAYSQLGLISGATIVRFRIFPDGHMEAFHVLEHEGHESLLISSKNAVNASFPFQSLPKDFPEEYLEITLKMIYPDLRKLAR